MCVCVCVCVCVCLGSLCLSGCFILWQQPVKMCHLSSGDQSMYTLFVLVFVCVTVCVCVCMPWVLVSVRMFHPLATACQDVSSFVRWPVHVYTVCFSLCVRHCVCVCVCVCTGSLCLSGCFILWQQPVKMCHLSSGDPSMYTLFVLVFVCVTVCVCVYALGPCVCQVVSSFGNSLSRCVIFRQVTRPCIHCLF